MEIMVRPLDREAEKRLLRVLAEVVLEVGKAGTEGGRCEAGDEVAYGTVGGVRVDSSRIDAVREEVCDGEKSCRVLSCIDDHA